MSLNVQEEVLRTTIDPALTDSALAGLLAEALGERVRPSDIEVLTGGCWNRVIGVRAGGRDVVCKISPRPNDAAIAREAEVLRVFRREGDLPVPEPLYVDDGAILPGTTLVMERLPGRPMHGVFGMLSWEQRERITDEIADYTIALHRRRSDRFGGVELAAEEREASWPKFWLARFDRTIEEIADSVPARLLHEVGEIHDELPGLIEIGGSAAMTHYDIWSGNVMIDPSADPPTVAGFIDVPGYYADYARELSFAMMFRVANRRFLARYTATHDIDDGFATRVAVYNLKMNLKHISMYPGESHYRLGAESCLSAIREAVAH